MLYHYAKGINQSLDWRLELSPLAVLSRGATTTANRAHHRIRIAIRGPICVQLEFPIRRVQATG